MTDFLYSDTFLASMDLLQLLLALVVLFALARAGSAIVSRFGLPGLIGEIVMGVIVANLAIGDFSLMESLNIVMADPTVEGSRASDVYNVIYAFAELGVIFLLFTVGLETKVKDLMSSGRAALLCAILGVIVPFICGYALVMSLGDGDTNHALFLAASMVATSVGITARIIKDMHLMDAKEARIIIAAAVIDDVLGMIVLAIVKGMVDSKGNVSLGDIASITLQAVAFVFVVIAACKWVVPRIYDYFDAKKKAKEARGEVPASINKLVLALIVCLCMAAFAECIGLAAIIGAFLAGMLFADHAWEWELEQKIDSISTLMLSFFFLNVGMQVNLSSMSEGSIIMLAAVALVLALISKFIGCGLGAKIGDPGLDKQSLGIIGVGMMPRGEVGIIIASIGLSITVVEDGAVVRAMSEELYTVVVLMSVITTIVAPPILAKLFRRKYSEDYKILDEDIL